MHCLSALVCLASVNVLELDEGPLLLLFTVLAARAREDDDDDDDDEEDDDVVVEPEFNLGSWLSTFTCVDDVEFEFVATDIPIIPSC